MKKNSVLLALTALVVFTLGSCKNTSKETLQTGEAQDAADVTDFETYRIDPQSSKIEWWGSKPTGEHIGTVKISEGIVKVAEDEVKGGDLVIDLNTIVNMDLESPEWNKKLVDHLKSEDFFYVDSFPNASFEITAIEKIESDSASHKITGNLSMRGETKSISFPVEISSSGNQLTADAPRFYIDRTEWGVNFKSKKIFSELKDDFISDEMGISFKLVAMKE